MPAQFFDLVDDLTVDPPKRDAIEQGAHFGWAVEFTADDVAGTTDADWVARMQVRRKLADQDTTDPLLDLDSGSIGGLTLTVVAPSTVRVEVAVDDEVTDGLPIGRFRYDLELERLADGYVRRVVEGKAQVRGEVTR